MPSYRVARRQPLARGVVVEIEILRRAAYRPPQQRCSGGEEGAGLLVGTLVRLHVCGDYAGLHTGRSDDIFLVEIAPGCTLAIPKPSS